MDIREILTRLRKGQIDRAVARAVGIDRKTVGRYRSWVTERALAWLGVCRDTLFGSKAT